MIIIRRRQENLIEANALLAVLRGLKAVGGRRSGNDRLAILVARSLHKIKAVFRAAGSL